MNRNNSVVKPSKNWFSNLATINHCQNLINETIFYSYLTSRGVGFKFWKKNHFLNMDIGFTHYVSVEVPDNINLVVRKNKLILSSNNKQKLNNYVFILRNIKLPDSYKGKGIRFFDENTKLKVGKIKN